MTQYIRNIKEMQIYPVLNEIDQVVAKRFSGVSLPIGARKMVRSPKEIDLGRLVMGRW